MRKAVESFCGAGGLSLGLQQAGFKVSYAFDNNEMAVNSYNNYFTDKHCYLKDVTKLSGHEILKSIGMAEGELDLFAGGPPCQGFSRQKKGAHNGDKRNNLVLDFARLVKEIRPKVFLLENVDMLGLKRGREFVDGVFNILQNYDLHPNFYNSSDYNLAQKRVRFIIVGTRKDLNLKFEIPAPITVNGNRRTVGEVIGNLPEPPDDYSVHPDFFNHQKARVTDINIERFSHVPQGGGWKDIPFELRLKCHQTVDTSKGGWPDVYGRLEWDGQCPTITGGFDSFTRGRYGHPKFNRSLTAREAALLQGFPVDFEFIGNRGEVRKQIGNAVPPPLAKVIGRAVIDMLESN